MFVNRKNGDDFCLLKLPFVVVFCSLYESISMLATRRLCHNFSPIGELLSAVLNVDNRVVEPLHESAVCHRWNLDIFVLLGVRITIENAADWRDDASGAGAKHLLHLQDSRNASAYAENVRAKLRTLFS